MCLFLAENIYAAGRCRWFSTSIVVLGVILPAPRQSVFFATCSSSNGQFSPAAPLGNMWRAGALQWTFFNVIWLSYLINAHDTNPWQGDMQASFSQANVISFKFLACTSCLHQPFRRCC